MRQILADVLAVSFECPADVKVGDKVEVKTPVTTGIPAVQKISVVGSPKVVGTVCRHRDDETNCTVETPFRERRDDRIAGENLVVGPFMFGPDNKVYKYPFAAPAIANGTVEGPFAITTDTNDVLKIAVNGGTAQTLTLTEGAALTAQQVCDDINTSATGFAAVVVSGKIQLYTLVAGQSLQVVTVTHDASATLGLALATHTGVAFKNDLVTVAGVIIVPGNKDAAVETLEY